MREPGFKAVDLAALRQRSADLGPAPIETMVLISHEVLDGGAVWLRYRLTSAK